MTHHLRNLLMPGNNHRPFPILFFFNKINNILSAAARCEIILVSQKREITLFHFRWWNEFLGKLRQLRQLLLENKTETRNVGCLIGTVRGQCYPGHIQWRGFSARKHYWRVRTILQLFESIFFLFWFVGMATIQDAK